MSVKIPHYRLSFSENDYAAMREVLQSGQIAQGKQVAELEATLARQLQTAYCCAVSSGTTALTLALRALGAGAKDEVIIPSYTCTALWHAIKAVQADAVFADIEPETFNLDPAEVRRHLSRRTKAIIFPHMFGQPGFIEEILELGVPVIEDIAQAYGAHIKHKPVGSFGTLSVISFYATKILGAGEGGAVLSNSSNFIQQVRNLREYDEKDDLTLRYNAKMTDLTAALALSQIQQYPEKLRRRQVIYDKYASILGSQLLLPRLLPDRQPNFYRCIASLKERTAAEVIALAERYGITLRSPVFKPIHLYPNAAGPALSLTETAWRTQFSLPAFPDLSDEEIEVVIKFLKKISNYE